MAGRFTETKYFDGCLNPVTVFHHGVKYLVPCGKCPACIVNRSNKWNFRLSDAIDNFSFTIYFTLTYDNHYVPRVHLRKYNGVYWFEFDNTNVRYNGVEDVERDDDLPESAFVSSPCWPIIENFGHADYFAYSSKRDIQLWLKLLRRDLEKTFVETNILSKNETRFRYYIISEYGPSTFRPHVHGVLFCTSQAVSEYLLQSSMYKNWQMCNKSLFDEYTHYCDNGCSGYLSSYLTCFNSLPSILKSREFKPFRLSSKGPAIGFERFDKEEISQGLYFGVTEYTKSVSRIDSTFLFQYPAPYLSGLFPKCFEYSQLSYAGLYRLYGKLYSEVIEKGKSFDDVSARLRENLRPIDYLCAKRCYDYCVTHENTSPYNYLYLLDMYYYKRGMFALRYYYEWQESATTLEILHSYSNFGDYRNNYYSLSDNKRFVFDSFCAGLGFDVLDIVDTSRLNALVFDNPLRVQYMSELENVLQEMVKLKKVNEMTGFAPHAV